MQGTTFIMPCFYQCLSTSEKVILPVAFSLTFLAISYRRTISIYPSIYPYEGECASQLIMLLYSVPSVEQF